MTFRFETFEPPPPLRTLVRRSFFAEGRIPYRTDKILPTGQVALLFTLGNPHRVGKSEDPADNPVFSYGWLDGLQTTPTYHTPVDGTRVLGVLFEPIGFHAIFGTDMASLRDRTADPRELLPTGFTDLVEAQRLRAADASAHAEIFGYLAAREQIPLERWLRDFYEAIVARQGKVDIDDWYRRSGHSARHAGRLFKRCVGVTPKVLCRIHRLLALLEAVDPSKEVSWTELAHAFEFYDQAHFNHEFRKLSGLFPGEYLEQRRRDLPELRQGESVTFAPQR